MNLWAAQTYLHKVGDREERVLTLYSSTQTSASEFDAALAQQLSGSLAFDAVHIVGYKNRIDLVSAWLISPENVTIDRLKTTLNDIESRIRLFFFDEQTGSHSVRLLSGEILNDAELIETEKCESLLRAFTTSGGEERAPTGTHYSKTSHRHADRFLRVSNVLENASNVQLLAFWLQQYIWGRDWKCIFVDTSSIYSVVLTAVHEAVIRGGLSECPQVVSFRSYAGIEEISTHQAKQSLFLISASTSNGLFRELILRGAQSKQIVTLFHLSKKQLGNGAVLCNLAGTNGEGLLPIENHDANSCELCGKHHHLIQIDGDQFSIAPPQTKVIEILAVDLPKEYKASLSAIAGLGAFYAFRRQGERVASLGINVHPILEGAMQDKSRAVLEKKRERWAIQRSQGMTISLRAVVSSNYVGSQEIAHGIVQEARAVLCNPNEIAVANSTDLRSMPPEKNRGAVVAAACIDDGKELLAISRTLRKVQEGGAIRYLCPVMLMGPMREATRLISNLTFGSQGRDTFQLEPLFRYEVECYEADAPWTEELNALRKLIDWADSVDEEIPLEIENRMLRLQQAQSDGMVNDLFWPNIEYQPLKLRSDFTLIDDSLRAPIASQADLYAVICIVLTSLRYSEKAARRLQNNSFERSVIAPNNFDRFSDGILQACILRAARPKELAFSTCEARISDEMKNILLYALSEEAGLDKAEAIVEFLLALITGRMSLHPTHLSDVCRAVINADQRMNPTALLMAKFLKAKHDC